MNIISIIRLKKNANNLNEYVDLIHKQGEPLVPFSNSTYNEWISLNKRTLLSSWSKDTPLHKTSHFFNEDPSSHFVSSYSGWLVPINQSKFSLNSRGYEDYFPNNLNNCPDELVGEYLYARFDYEGNGICTRNKAGTIPLYYAENNECYVISNRACIAALVSNKSTFFKIDPVLQVWMFGISYPLSKETLFKNVEILPQGTIVTFTSDNIVVKRPNIDIWYDENLYTSFRDNRKKYWDTIFEKMIAALRILDKLETDTIPIRLLLSGGKDSRLLFAFFKNKGLTEKVSLRTGGPPYSSDVVVANMIAMHYNLKHIHYDSIFTDLDYSNQIPSHAFMTEGMMSPFDLQYNIKPVNEVFISGMEGGLRTGHSPLKKKLEDIKKILTINNPYFLDPLNILKDEVKVKNKTILDEWFQKASNNQNDINNLPVRLHLETRFHRWVSASQVVYSIRGFGPNFLSTDIPILATYNTNAEVRSSELFHYEMMNRVDLWLVNECPFAQQIWSPLLKKEVKNLYKKLPSMMPNFDTKTKVIKGSIAAFKANHKKIFSFLLEEPSHEIFNFIDYNNLKKASEKDVSTRGYMALWNIIKFKYLYTIKDFKDLSSVDGKNKQSIIPEIRVVNKKPLTDKEFSNRNYCNSLLEKAERMEVYRKSIIELLGNWPILIKDKDYEINELTEYVEQLQKDLEQKAKELKQYKQKQEMKVEELKNTFYNSVSWKITTPLRTEIMRKMYSLWLKLKERK